MTGGVCVSQPINQLCGQSHVHSVMAILYAIINLSPHVRMTLPAIQVATLANDQDCKMVGMREIINGGTTSIGAQLRRLELPGKQYLVRTKEGNAHELRQMCVHAVMATGDFPAMASLLPFKGSVSANLFDRHSNVDRRSKHYFKENSYLRPATADVPHYFQRRTYKGIKEVQRPPPPSPPPPILPLPPRPSPPLALLLTSPLPLPPMPSPCAVGRLRRRFAGC